MQYTMFCHEIDVAAFSFWGVGQLTQIISKRSFELKMFSRFMQRGEKEEQVPQVNAVTGPGSNKK